MIHPRAIRLLAATLIIGQPARDVLGKQPQTWTMADGTKVVGKVVDFTRKDVTIQRRRGRIYVNDRVFENLPPIYQAMLPRIVNHFERINPVDKVGLESWAVRQRARPQTFQLEGVVMEFDGGGEYAIPFFFLRRKICDCVRPTCCPPRLATIGFSAMQRPWTEFCTWLTSGISKSATGRPTARTRWRSSSGGRPRAT